MANKFRLGLVAELNNGEDGSRAIMSEDWNYFFDFFRARGDVALFDWKSVGDDFSVDEYALGSRNFSSVVKGKAYIRNLCDVIYIGQLGKIHERKNDFLKFLDIMEDFHGQVINPVDTIRNNLSKGYLLELQDKGISVIPTIDVSRGYSFSDLERLNFPNYRKSIDDLVLKPKVFGEQGNGVVRLSEIEGEDGLRKYLGEHGEVIAQPLLDDIYVKGEDSFIFTGRDFSHGLNKVTGKFKINLCSSDKSSPKYSPKSPTPEQMVLCQSALDAWPTPFGYARIDIVSSDVPLIGEVEMVNPAGYALEIGALETYSKNLNKTFNEVFERGRV